MQYTRFNCTESRISKRIFSMSYYNQLINAIDSLIRDKGKYDRDGYSLSFYDLSTEEQNELISLKIEDDERDTSDIFKDDNITSSLIKMLNNNTLNNASDFANSVREASYSYYRKSLEDLIEDRCGWVTKEFNLCG